LAAKESDAGQVQKKQLKLDLNFKKYISEVISQLKVDGLFINFIANGMCSLRMVEMPAFKELVTCY